MSITHIFGGDVYAPEPQGLKDVLIAGTNILSISQPLADSTVCWVKTPFEHSVKRINASDCYVVPGFIDIHVHITGGGGEQGPASRTREASIDELVRAGITTVFGVLGTDTVTRSLPNLVAKTRSLCQQGITAYCYTGGYRVPPPTITGTIQGDLCLIEQVQGVGEIAISDHRGNQPTTHQLASLASDAHVGGMLGAKSGKVHVHVGTHESGLHSLFEVIETTAVPVTVFHPTHMERSQELVTQGMKWLQLGGSLDFSASEKALSYILHMNKTMPDVLPFNHSQSKVSISSDAYGSLPVFNDQGELVAYEAAKPSALLEAFQQLVKKHNVPLEAALTFFTRAPAAVMKLQHKADIAVGKDADILLLSKRDLSIVAVFAKGNQLL